MRWELGRVKGSLAVPPWFQPSSRFVPRVVAFPVAWLLTELQGSYILLPWAAVCQISCLSNCKQVLLEVALALLGLLESGSGYTAVLMGLLLVALPLSSLVKWTTKTAFGVSAKRIFSSIPKCLMN